MVVGELRRIVVNPGKMEKIIARYESGLLSAAEVANSLLFDLVSEPELDTGFVSSLDSLPEEIRREFHRLLGKIKEADFRWSPFLLTSFPPSSDSAETSAKLRRICTLLG
jgi:hypothetical protein